MVRQAAPPGLALDPEFFHEPIDAPTTEFRVPQLHAHRQAVNAIQATMLRMQRPQFPLHGMLFATDLGVMHGLALSPGIVSTPVDAKHTTHCRDREDPRGLIRLYELVDGANFVYRSLRLVANQAAAFSRISLSSRNCLFSLRRRFSSSASDSSSRVSDSASTQCRIVCFAGFVIVGQRSNRTSLTIFKDDLAHATLVDIDWACNTSLFQNTW